MHISTRTVGKTAMATAIAALLASPMTASADPVVIDITQTLSGDVAQNLSLNQITLDAAGKAAQALLDLGVDGKGTSQLSAVQANVMGWNTLSGTSSTAIVVNADALSLSQSYNNTVLGVGDVLQSSPNLATVTATPALGSIGNATINGLSQISANTLNVAGIQFTANAAELVSSQQLPDQSATTGSLQQTAVNLMRTQVTATLPATGVGSSIIDGKAGTAADAANSIQYGLNTVAALSLFGTGTASVAGNTITVQPQQLIGDYSGTVPSTVTLNSGIANIAAAAAVNSSLAVPAPSVTPTSGILIDPAVKNLDQIAVYSGNTINGYNPQGTIALVGAETLAGGGTGTFTSAIEQSATNLVDKIAAINVITALNGNGIAGFGDSALSNLNQTLSTSLNAVNIAGIKEVKNDAGTITTAAVPANATVGKILSDDANPLSDATYARALGSFDQTIGSLTVQGLALAANLPSYTINGLASDPVVPADIALATAAVGNYAGASTITGNVSADKLKQMLSISANGFSVDGNLTGATLPAQGTPVANLTYFGTTVSGTQDLSIASANNANWSMTQTATNVDIGNTVALPNYAFATTTTGNVALNLLSQTGVAQLNNLNVGKDLTGNYLQAVDTNSIALQNVARASATTGNITGSDGKLAATDSAATDRSQLLATMLNNLTAGGTFSGVIEQRADSVSQGLSSTPLLNDLKLTVAGAGSINVGNINQTTQASLNSLSLGGNGTTAVGTVNQYASDVVHSALNNMNATTASGTVQLGGLSQTISSSINTAALGAMAASLTQQASGGISQTGLNQATIGGAGATLASINGINQVISNRVNAITTAIK